MKTNQILTRQMAEFNVLQRTSDGYFDGSSLLLQWNKSHLRNSKRKRQMGDFINSANTVDFIEALREDVLSQVRKNVPADNQVIKEIKGRTTTGNSSECDPLRPL